MDVSKERWAFGAPPSRTADQRSGRGSVVFAKGLEGEGDVLPVFEGWGEARGLPFLRTT